VNVTQISGGTRSNVIPDEARAVIDVRVPTMADAARIDAALRSRRRRMRGPRSRWPAASSRPPLERSAHVEGVCYDQARAIARELGLS
jgi:glutamate carboxypeptidase